LVENIMAAVVAILAILPEGTVRDEGTFIMLIGLLAAFVGAAIYLRVKKRSGGGSATQ
jgi:hypothetical protein